MKRIVIEKVDDFESEFNQEIAYLFDIYLPKKVINSGSDVNNSEADILFKLLDNKRYEPDLYIEDDFIQISCIFDDRREKEFTAYLEEVGSKFIELGYIWEDDSFRDKEMLLKRSIRESKEESAQFLMI